ncbi:calcium-binding protein [Aestuariivirga sp.]|uniref:calcium-binding protein n=1 Tax=Aestuariivirga sp. TaxID=2650926 RepID=UPI0035946396
MPIFTITGELPESAAPADGRLLLFASITSSSNTVIRGFNQFGQELRHNIKTTTNSNGDKIVTVLSIVVTNVITVTDLGNAKSIGLIPAILGGGKDTFLGGSQDDRIFGEAFFDWNIEDRSGPDIINGGGGDDMLSGGGGIDKLNGGTGIDIYNCEHPNAGSIVNISTATLSAAGILGSLEGVAPDILAPFSSRIMAQGSFDAQVALDGFGSRDVVTNCETIYGSDFDDILVGVTAGGRLWGRSGNDILIATGGNNSLDGDSGNDLVIGSNGEDDLLGQSGNDILIGGGKSDYLDGSDGDDVLDGGAGSDQLQGGDGTDTVFGGKMDDELFGGDGVDWLTGGEGADYMVGGQGEDWYHVDDVADEVFEEDVEGEADTITTSLQIYSLELMQFVENLVFEGQASRYGDLRRRQRRPKHNQRQ